MGDAPPSPAPEKNPKSSADAYMLSRADYPLKDLPKVNGIRDARYQVVFRQSVLDEIHAHGKSSPEAEVCGVLIGDVYSDRLAPWAYIEHCIRGNDADGKQTQVTITSETWTRIHETLEKDYPDKKIVGWYHTHPGFGIFLSGMDLFIQDNFFNQPWQIATVYDPHSGDEGTFIWRSGKSVRENSLVENDTGAVETPGVPGPASDQVAELARRVKRLERRLDFMLTGFLVLVLIALTAPLIIFAFAPDTLKNLPILQRPLFPLRASPTTMPASGPAPQPPTGSTPANLKAPLPYRSISPSDENENTGNTTTPEENAGGPKILRPKAPASGKK
jgi:proteasome lid subunit RPN8/RPN11